MIGEKLNKAINDQIKNELEMVGEDKSGLLMIDRELGQRAYPPGSPFGPSAVGGEDA